MKCSLCGSLDVNKTTCPLNPDAINPDELTHPLVKENKTIALAQVIKQMSFFQLLKARQTDKMMKQMVDEEIIHRHNVKFGKNNKPIGQRIYELPPANFHYGIYLLEQAFLNYKLSPELYDEFNLILNYFLRKIVMELDTGWPINSTILKIVRTGHPKSLLIIEDIDRYHSAAVNRGLSQWNSVADVPYQTIPVIIDQIPYYGSKFMYSEIDPKEVQRVVSSAYSLSDSDIIRIATVLSIIGTEIMDAKKELHTREDVKKAALALFNM